MQLYKQVKNIEVDMFSKKHKLQIIFGDLIYYKKVEKEHWLYVGKTFIAAFRSLEALKQEAKHFILPAKLIVSGVGYEAGKDFYLQRAAFQKRVLDKCIIN